MVSSKAASAFYDLQSNLLSVGHSTAHGEQLSLKYACQRRNTGKGELEVRRTFSSDAKYLLEKVLGGEIEVCKCSCDGWFKRLNTGLVVKMQSI